MKCDCFGNSILEITNALNYNHFTLILRELKEVFLPANLEKRQAKHPSKSEHSALACGYAHQVEEVAGLCTSLWHHSAKKDHNMCS